MLLNYKPPLKQFPVSAFTLITPAIKAISGTYLATPTPKAVADSSRFSAVVTPALALTDADFGGTSLQQIV